MDLSQTLKNLTKVLGARFGPKRILTGESLARHCNWKVGGAADLFFTAFSKEDLIAAIESAWNHNVPVTLIGFGANALISDDGIRGLVILNRAEKVTFNDYTVNADSGTNLALLARKAARQNIGGLEFLIGIPGTVGAAVFGNAGTREEWISTVLMKALVLFPTGELTWLTTEELGFRYRFSNLKENGGLVISATLKGIPAHQEHAETKMQEHLQARKNQPGGSSAGSVFKNPSNDFAGRLIEKCGLKGCQIGGAQISEMHANFIINRGNATATDIKNLIRKIQKKVKENFGIQLEEEIQYLGDW